MNELPEHQKMTVLFALATGLRQKNVVRLEWSQVDLNSKHAWVQARNSKNRKAVGHTFE